MRATMIIAIVSAALAIAGFITCSPVLTREKEKKEDATISIPKEEIYTTSSETGFRERLRASFVKSGENWKPVHDYSQDLDEIGKKHGPSSVFLVRGDYLA